MQHNGPAHGEIAKKARSSHTVGFQVTCRPAIQGVCEGGLVRVAWLRCAWPRLQPMGSKYQKSKERGVSMQGMLYAGKCSLLLPVMKPSPKLRTPSAKILKS